MSSLSSSTFGLFLTEKHSLQVWDRLGMLSREIAPSNILAGYFKKIYIFSYGEEQDRQYQSQLASNVEIVPKAHRFSMKNYLWTLPLHHRQKIKQCHFIKTNQFRCRAAIVAKLLHPRLKFILRTGYLASQFAERQNQSVSLKLWLWEKFAYHLCDRALVASAEDKNYLVDTYRLPPAKIEIVPNYIDTDLFHPQPQNQYQDRVVYTGKLHSQKNLPLLIEALSETGLGLDIIGEPTASQQPLKEELLHLGKEKGVIVNFLGKINNDQLPKILNHYEIFVLPSLYEGTPKALLEAMSCGLACIATDIVGSRALIKHKISGLLSEISAPALRTNILKLKNNPDLRKALGQQARVFVLENFSLASQIKKEIALYAQMA